MADIEGNNRALSPLEHIRKRPDLYIGRFGNGSNEDDGIYILLKEVVDNSVDEFIMGFGNRIEVSLQDNQVKVRDYGRGIPLDKLKECVSLLNTGSKYDDERFQFCAGLKGIGTKAVNALSKSFFVKSFRDGKYASVSFERGKLVTEDTGETAEENGTLAIFTPDEEIFPDFHFDEAFILDQLWHYTYLNKGLSFEFNKKIIKYKEMKLVGMDIRRYTYYPVIQFKNQHLEFAFTHTTDDTDAYISFVNRYLTIKGGTHLAAFKEGLRKGINEYFKKAWTAKDISTGIIAAVSIQMQNPMFDSQRKSKLISTEVKSWIVSEVKQAVIDGLMKDKNTADSLFQKLSANENLNRRKSIPTV